MPFTFQDSKGREWNTTINVGVVKRLKAAGYDFEKLRADRFKGFLALDGDADGLSELVWLIVSKQAEAANVSQEDFFEALDGAALDRCFDAFAAAYTDFTPNVETRDALAKVLDRLRKIRSKSMGEINAQLDKLEELANEHLQQQAAAYSDDKLREMFAKKVAEAAQQ